MQRADDDAGVSGVESLKSLGIVGFGSFGQFMAKHLTQHFALAVTDVVDRSAQARQLGASWLDATEAIGDCEVVVLAVPSRELEPVVGELAPRLSPGTLVMDVCSVKVRTVELLERLLPADVEIVGSHPMFGPQSGRDGIEDLKIVLCPVRTQRLERIRAFLAGQLGLQVLVMDPARHDREMAYIQGLTHWIAKALAEISMPDLELSTVAYRHLVSIEEILRDDSFELFLTITRDNPFAADARHELLERLRALEQQIEAET